MALESTSKSSLTSLTPFSSAKRGIQFALGSIVVVLLICAAFAIGFRTGLKAGGSESDTTVGVLREVREEDPAGLPDRYVTDYWEYTDATGKKLRHGQYIVSSSDGTTMESGQYLNGNKIGTWRGFMPDGTLRWEYIYANKGRDYVERRYTISGENAYYEYEYRNGVKTGREMSYYSKQRGGGLHQEDYYIQDMHVGRSFWDSGRIASYSLLQTTLGETDPKKIYDKDFIVYFENGLPDWSDKPVENGKEESLFRKWYDTGILALNQYRRGNKPHGRTIEYNEDGSVRSTKEYANGVLVSESNGK